MKAQKFLAAFMAAALPAAGAAPPAAAAPPSALVSIGVAGAVKGLVKAVPPAAPESAGRVLQSGKPLYVNEHVTTGPGGHLQIMLKDETVFTLGPNSDIVLDEFVYNPDTEAGKVSASVTKGVFRFITGNIGKKDPSQMEVKLPAGTIGIRGTIVAGQVNADGTGMAVLLGPGPAVVGERVGAFNLTNSAGSVFVEKPGFGSALRGADVPPTPPALIPVAQMKALLSDLAPKTVAQRMEDGKQMMAERLAQKLAPDKDGKEKLAEKMMAGEPLTPEEQAQAREQMEKGGMSEMETRLAEKMMAGETLTPDELHKADMMMAGERMMEHMGTERMTPEQRLLAEKMMGGSLSPQQQQEMMNRMSPEQQAMMEGMLPPPPPPGSDPYRYEGGDQTGMIGSYPTGEVYEGSGGTTGSYDSGAMTDPYGGLETYTSTEQFFDTFYDPSLDPALNTGYVPPPTDGTTLTGPTTWDAIRSQIVTGTGYFPGQSGAFHLNTCGGGACVNPVGTWSFSNMLVDFEAKTITGTAGINANADNIASPISNSTPINVNFSALTGSAVIPAGGTGPAQYLFSINDAGGIPAHMLIGNATYNTPPLAGDVHGAGEPLVSYRVDGTPP
ncbi:MAG: FecR domain-containing protein [Elusimicrobia bacterium]|nr:FecR domain-containing protein [Elusimicrobiota bacterium]